MTIIRSWGLVAAAAMLACTAPTDAGNPETEEGRNTPEPTEGAQSTPRKIAFRSAVPDPPAIFTADADGSNKIRLTPVNLYDMQPAWSPDGKRIAFSSAVPNGDSWNIFVMNADGTNRIRLTSGREGGYQPAWSPDGRRITFMRHQNLTNAQIFVINADGTGLVQLTSAKSRDESPEWSPDGNWIVFSRDMTGWENKGLFLIKPDGSQLRQLTSGYFDEEPTWSPDGKHIAFIREDPTGDIGLLTVGADGSMVRTITQGNYHTGNPAWWPDGRSVTFGQGGTDSRYCIDDEWGGTGETYACGQDVRRVYLDGMIDQSWSMSGITDLAWQR